MVKTIKKIPKNAMRVFQGQVFEVWQWRQTMYDGTTQTFELLKRSNTAQVIPVVGDKILIQKQQQPDKPKLFTSLPGGRCDEHENPLTAAKRELLEETGYVSSDWALWKQQNPVSKIIWTVYTFIARNCRQRQSPQLDAGEKIKNYLITFNEFSKLSENPNFFDPPLQNYLWHIRLDKKLKQEFKDLLFK